MIDPEVYMKAAQSISRGQCSFTCHALMEAQGKYRGEYYWTLDPYVELMREYFDTEGLGFVWLSLGEDVSETVRARFRVLALLFMYHIARGLRRE